MDDTLQSSYLAILYTHFCPINGALHCVGVNFSVVTFSIVFLLPSSFSGYIVKQVG